MTVADHADVVISKQPLNPNLRSGVPGHADIEIDPALAQSLHILPALRGKNDAHQWRTLVQALQQKGAKLRHESIAGANDEGLFQRLQIKRKTRLKQGIRPLHDLANGLAQGLGPRGGNQLSPCAHQHRIIQLLAYPSEGPAHCGRAKVHLFRRSNDTSLR
ncbi:MAG: hypothetical protein BGO12_20640 [Verrucomicrobia bacterium 61-8]|nr:MAG: hypothetical protein BGO12_20640 [Verrucomicrobia bacterium 61-8]